MLTPPPFLVNLSLFGGGFLQPVPQGDWKLFCDGATAKRMLAVCQRIAADAQLVDILNPHSVLPGNVSRFPVSLYKTDLSSDVSAYVIYGTIPLTDGETAVLYEAAGWLSDCELIPAPWPDGLDLEAQSYQGHVGKSNLYAYVSSYDPTDSDCYWGDQPIPHSLAPALLPPVSQVTSGVSIVIPPPAQAAPVTVPPPVDTAGR